MIYNGVAALLAVIIAFKLTCAFPCSWSGWGTCDTAQSFLQNATNQSIEEFEAISSNVYLRNNDLMNTLENWAQRQSDDVKEAFKRRQEIVTENARNANLMRIRFAGNISEEAAALEQRLVQINANENITRVEQSRQVSDLMNNAPTSLVQQLLDIEDKVVAVALNKTFVNSDI